MEQRIVQVTVARRVPALLVIVGFLRTGEQGLLKKARVPRLIEGRDSEVLIGVLLDDAKRIVVRIERGHEDERDIDALSGVEVLDLAHSKIEECHVIFDLERALGTGHA
jgi:hypothetical protein